MAPRIAEWRIQLRGYKRTSYSRIRLSNLLLDLCPRAPRQNITFRHFRICHSSQPCHRFELSRIDCTAGIDDVVANVYIFDETENESGVNFRSCLVMDVNCLKELRRNLVSCVSWIATRAKKTYFAFHGKSTFFHSRSFDVYTVGLREPTEWPFTNICRSFCRANIRLVDPRFADDIHSEPCSRTNVTCGIFCSLRALETRE